MMSSKKMKNLFNENFTLVWQFEKMIKKNGQIFLSGQMCFFIASTLEKGPNFSKLAMKWPQSRNPAQEWNVSAQA